MVLILEASTRTIRHAGSLSIEKERSQEEIENARFLCVLADGLTDKSITAQDPTGARPLTLQTLFLLHLLMPLVLLLLFRKVFKP